MTFLRSRRRGAVHVTIVDDEVERFDVGTRSITSMNRLTSITDDHVLHEPPDNVIENRDAEKRAREKKRNQYHDRV